jgi:hypothetical protein
MRGKLLAFAVFQAIFALPAIAQNGIQWSGNARSSVERAREMEVPVMFWVTERTEHDDDAVDDLKDAQEDAFRDPIVVGIAERYFVPCRVARNSNVLSEAQKLGLPTDFGLYIALVTPTGKVLDQIDPRQVATPEALAERLAAASRAHRADVYTEKCRGPITDAGADKSDVRRAVRAVWKMHIYSADADLAALVGRSDLTDQERAKLYKLLAEFGTPACTEALLTASETDGAAKAALGRAEPAALPALIASLPGLEGEVSTRQFAAYSGVVAIAKVRGGAKDEAFWAGASAEDRQAELDRVTAAGQAVHDAWQEREGKWR